MTYVIRVGGRYFVGFCGHDSVFCKNSYFADRFSVASAARTYVRANLPHFRTSLDVCRIVRLKPRTTEEKANAE
jgi:hypothetical protein